MTHFRVLSAVLLGLLGIADVGYAQEQQRLGNILVTDVFELGAGVVFTMEGTTANAFEFRMRIDPTADVNWTLPASAGAAGTQLQTSGIAGEEILSWASAGSTRDIKILAGLLAPPDALAAILATPIHRFHYKSGVGTQDAATEYAGPVADEAPWAMHHNGTILNPINTVGYTVAAIQAQQAQIEAQRAQIEALTAEIAARRVGHRTWRTLWLWRTKE